MAASEAYVKLNGKYLAEAGDLLAKEDGPQASEKLWGAAAEMVKAVAARRGVTLGTHRSLAEFVSMLQKEHPEWDLLTGFHVAQSLHVNFYEDHLPLDHVRAGERAVREFVERLKRLV